MVVENFWVPHLRIIWIRMESCIMSLVHTVFSRMTWLRESIVIYLKHQLLLLVAKLPHKFWYHAVAHAAFLINRMPCKVLKMTSPFEQLYGKKPVLSTLKVFGSTIYPYLRPYNVHKLQSRYVQCVFLGYSHGYKCVICYNMLTGKLLISWNVLHGESFFFLMWIWSILLLKVQFHHPHMLISDLWWYSCLFMLITLGFLLILMLL